MGVDPAAIAAGWDIVKRLGPDAARQLLQILELPDEARWAVGTSMFLKQGTLRPAVLGAVADHRLPRAGSGTASLATAGAGPRSGMSLSRAVAVAFHRSGRMRAALD